MARVTRSEDERLIIAYNIKTRRKNKYPTSGQCAKEYNVPHSQWSPWESGRRTPDPKRLESIAEFLGCKLDDLFVPPDNWEEEKKQFLVNRDGIKEEENKPEPKSEEKKVSEDATLDYLQIMSMLAKVQSKFDKGEIDPTIFYNKMQSIKEYVNFSYHSIMSEKQPSE